MNLDTDTQDVIHRLEEASGWVYSQVPLSDTGQLRGELSRPSDPTTALRTGPHGYERAAVEDLFKQWSQRQREGT